MRLVASSSGSTWQRILHLGQDLLASDSLVAQRDLIVETVSRLFGAQAELWLDESLFRLPGMSTAPIFSSSPTTGEMKRSLETSEAFARREIAVVPLKNQDLTLGVLQVTRPSGLAFRKKERELLDGLAGHVTLALILSHREAIEQWRLEQLTLVRKVGAQIANATDINSLARRVTELIRRTFHYYYVAIFTLDPKQEMLRFCSSAGPVKGRRRRRLSPVLKVHIGEGLIGHAAASGQEVVANDVHAEPRFQYIDSLPETQSEVVLPLKIEDRVLGVLDVQSNRLGAFHPNDLLVLRALADNIATAVDGARLYGDLQKRAKQLAVVAEVGKDITSTLDLDELLNKVAALIHERFGYPYVHVYTVHHNRRQIHYMAGSGARSRDLQGYILDLDNAEGIIPWVARNGQPVLANDVRHEPRYHPSPVPPENTRSELAVPFIYDNKVVGVLDLQSSRRNTFTEDDLFVFQMLADNIASAIHNADLYRSERWRRQVADSLREVAGLLSANVSVDEVLDAILKELERNLPCDVSAIWLVDGDELYLAHIHGADPLEVENARYRWPEAAHFLAGALAAEQPSIRKPTDPIGPTGAACGFPADYSSIAAALRIGEQPVGVLTLSHHTSGRYGHEAQAMTTTFASYAAVAIENARLYDSTQEQAYASAALLQVAQTVVSQNTMDEILASVVRITPMLVGVKSCAVYLWTSDLFRPAQAYGIPKEAMPVLWGRNFASGDFPLLDTVRERGQTIVGLLNLFGLDDWRNPQMPVTEEETIFALETGERLLIGFPLAIKQDFYGVMLVEETSEAHRFRRKRIEIINGIAQQVALAIQNEHLQQEMLARERLEHEVHLARQIQQAFLPEYLPVFPNWELAACWQTARQVGGDFYDVFELPDGRLGLLIADVSDKGIPAALFMALTRTLVRAVVYDVPSPAEALRRVNDLIIPDNRQGMFVTAVYAVLSLQTGELIYANAGHNPPLFVLDGGRVIERLSRTGMALGVEAGTLIEERKIRLSPGDLLLLYTDGLTEAFTPEGEPYGEERVCDLIKSNPAASVQALLNALEASIADFLGGQPASDDLTMLAAKRLT